MVGPVALVLDNGRYQRNALVIELAKELGIELLFLPSYSPNLNLIERQWRFVKGKAAYGRYYPTFADFRAAFTFPGNRKIRGRTQKVPLREVAQEWLPSDVIDRPKASFGAPLRAWVTNDLGGLIDDVLLDGQLASSGFLQPAALRRMVTDQRDGRRDMSKQLWQLLSMELWYRNVRAAGVGTS